MARSQAQTSKNDDRKIQVSQTDSPLYSLEQTLTIAKGLWDDFAGKDAPPHQLALSLDISPTSSAWRMLCGAAIAYGLTNGGYNATSISLTDLGRRIVSPLDENDVPVALQQAVLKPRIHKEFFTKYDKAKFPKDEIAKNVLISLGLPKDRGDRALEIVRKNGDFAGLILSTKTGPFVAIGGGDFAKVIATPPVVDDDEVETDDEERSTLDGNPNGLITFLDKARAPPVKPKSNRVFLTHGKNLKILEQVKELVAYGKFEPVIAQERETAAKPVPEKVMDEMRSCDAAVIHVGIDGVLFDKEGNEVPQINRNVLIEVGAAMALYGRRFILLVEEGVELPSNLKGLYECRYKGDELSMTATMKLLRAFNDFT